MSGPETAALRRDIGFSGSAFLCFNGIVGAGIFALPATLHGQFGTFSPWLFPIFGLLILLIALPFAGLAAIVPVSGGPAAYAAPFGRFAAFQAGWLYYLARVTALAANATVFATYAASLVPGLGSAAGRIACIIGLVGLFTAVNIVGVKRAIRVLDGLTLLKALPLVGLALWALIAAAGSLPPPGPAPALSAVEAAALVILYAFVGFENSVVPAEETRDERRTIPRALISTIVATAVTYFLVQLAYISVMPAGAAPEAPLAAFAEALVGPIGAVVLAATALFSIAANLSSAMTSAPRVTFALTRQGSLPRWFGVVHGRFATPANSILFMGLVIAALAISGSFVWLAVVSTLARLFVYGISIAALPATRRANGLTAGPLTLLLVAGGLAVCLWAAAQSTAQSWAALAGAVAGGLLLFLLARRQAGSSSAETVSSIQPPPSKRSPS